MEPFYKTYKTAWRSFYKLLFLAVLFVILACIGSIWGPFNEGAKLKFMWIAVIVIDVFILLYIFVQRKTMSLTLKDNPDKPEDQEVSYVEYNPLKPFSPDFKKSIEIGLAKIEHIRLNQTMMQTILNIGDIVVASSGTGAEEIHARNIPDPQSVRDEIQLRAGKYSKKSSQQDISSSSAQ